MGKKAKMKRAMKRAIKLFNLKAEARLLGLTTKEMRKDHRDNK